MTNSKHKLVIMVTHGSDDPEMATIPFVMATTALAQNVEVIVGLQGNGVSLGIRARVANVAAAGFPPLMDLLKTYAEAGGKIYVGGPSAGWIPQQELVEGATIVGPETFVMECVDATNVLVY